MAAKRSFREALLSYAQPKVATMLVLGSASGLPLLTIAGTLGIWLTDYKVSMTSIGLFAYAALPYTIKWAWAPIIDQVKLPFLHDLLGKRRSWMLLSQVGILIALLGLSIANPATDLLSVALFALLLGFSGASQDISIDAWRIEVAPKEDQGAMVAAYQLGYRLCAFATGAGALFIAEATSWSTAMLFLAALVVVAFAATLIAQRTKESDASQEARTIEKQAGSSVAWVYGSVIGPFVDFFRRYKWAGLLVLVLIGCYRLPDFVMGTMAGPMYRQSFSLTEIGVVVKTIGVWVTIAGAFIGGLFVSRFGIMKSLFIGLISVIIGNLGYAWLATRGHDVTALSIAIGVENIASGFAGTALIAYMSSLTSTAFTATQYALFSSFYALPGKLLGGLSGAMVDWYAANRATFEGLLPVMVDLPEKVVGFVPFFITTALSGIPAFLLLIYVARRERRNEAAESKAETAKA